MSCIADGCRSALKLQMHAMLLSTTYNRLETVLSNLAHSFEEVAQKSYHYIRSLPPVKQPPDKMILSRFALHRDHQSWLLPAREEIY